MFLIWNTDLRV